MKLNYLITCSLLSVSVYANELSLGMVLEPPSLDPTAGAAAAIDEIVYANVFEGLTGFASDGSVVPRLAKTWDISEDGLEYVFHLETGVSFHDGEAMTAEDVVYSFERAMATDTLNAQKALFTGITNVEALDAETVKITLDKPNGNLTFNLAWGDAVIVDAASAETNSENPVGTGPFKFVEWRRGDRLILEKSDTYWGDEVALDKAEFRFIADPDAAYNAVMSEDVDAFPNFPAPEKLAQLEADSRFKVIVGSTEGETILAMNHRSEALNNIHLRKAITKAIDRQAIIDGAMFGYGTPIGTHFAPHNPAYLDLTDESNFDLEIAREELEASGYDGTTLKLTLPPPSYARRGGEIVAALLRNVGIETDIQNVEWSEWLDGTFKAHDFDLTIVSHTEPMDIGIYADPDYYFGYDNAVFQEEFASLSEVSDVNERTAILQNLQTMISADYVNAYLFQLAKTGVANEKIEGLWENSPTQANDLTQVRWRE